MQYDGLKRRYKTIDDKQYMLVTNLATDDDIYYVDNGHEWIPVPETIELFALFYQSRR